MKVSRVFLTESQTGKKAETLAVGVGAGDEVTRSGGVTDEGDRGVGVWGSYAAENPAREGSSLPSRGKPYWSLTTVLGPEFILQGKGWGESPTGGSSAKLLFVGINYALPSPLQPALVPHFDFQK